MRVEAWDKVTGRARYSSDVRLPGQLYAAVLRSPHPHARVLRVTCPPLAGDGVHAVLSACDSPDISWYETSKLFDRTDLKLESEVHTTMEALRSAGLATERTIVEFLDASGKETKGVLLGHEGVRELERGQCLRVRHSSSGKAKVTEAGKDTVTARPTGMGL